MVYACEPPVGQFYFPFQGPQSKAKYLEGVVDASSHLLRYVVLPALCLMPVDRVGAWVVVGVVVTDVGVLGGPIFVDAQCWALLF